MQIWEALPGPTELEDEVATKESVFLLLPLEILMFSQMWELMCASMDPIVKRGAGCRETHHHHQVPIWFFCLLACMQGPWRHQGKVLARIHQGALLMQYPCCCTDGQGLSSLPAQAVLSVPWLMEKKSGVNFLCSLHHSGEVVGGKLRWCGNEHCMRYQCKNESSKKTRQEKIVVSKYLSV